MDVLREINKKLKYILPVGVFCCATIIDMNFDSRRMRVWNGGLPECYLYRRQAGVIEGIKSTHLPLGVLADKDFKDDCLTYDLDIGDRFYMWSDGIHESRNSNGDMFGEQRLLDTFEQNRDPNHLFPSILDRVQEFVGDGERDDDLSLIEIQMQQPEDIDAVVQATNTHGGSGLMEWNLDFEVGPSSFRFYDPLPLLLNILVEVPGLSSHSGNLYTILSELYSNALEHGVLGLDSALKQSAEGFSKYYELREQRLAKINEGFIHFRLEHVTRDDGGKLVLMVKDSGKGFDHQAKMNATLSSTGYCGRGIPLLHTMCDSFEYLGCGNHVKVVFNWQNDTV